MSSNEWGKVILGELITHRKGFAFKSKDLIEKGSIVVKVTNFTENSIDIRGCYFISEDEKEKYLSYELRTDDIVIATVGSWPNNPNSIVGKVVRVPPKANSALLNQNAVILRVIKDLNQIFFYYRLRNKDFADHLIAGARGSANQASISLDDIFRFTFTLPTKLEQDKIAHILSTLDEKIENNLESNKTLEEVAQTLFKEWFINFNYPNADGKMKQSEFGEIPEDWEVRKLADVLEIKYGKDHKHLETGGIPVYGSGGIMRYVDKALYEKESILIPRKGTLSNLFYVNKPFWSVDTMFYTKIKNQNSGKYLFLLLQTLNLASMNVGTAVPSLTTDILNNIKIIIPSEDVLKMFDVIMLSLFEKIHDNINENEILKEIRDSLLPKLMNGEIKI